MPSLAAPASCRSIAAALIGVLLGVVLVGCRSNAREPSVPSSAGQAVRPASPAGTESADPASARLAHAGSGIIVSERGHILTHAAVVEGATRIVVEISRQDRRDRSDAAVVASDAATGLTLLQARSTSRWVMRWQRAARPERATLCGWPFVGLALDGVHEREMSSAAGPITDSELGFPVAPGYEGGVLADGNARGVGMLTATTAAHSAPRDARKRGEPTLQLALISRPRYVPAAAILRFLADHGIQPPAERADFDRPWPVKLGWLQNYTVQIEREPARDVRPGLPGLIRSHRVRADDIVALTFGPMRRGLIAECWSAPNRTFQVVLPVSVAGVTGRQFRHRRDAKGDVLELDARGQILRGLAAINGYRGFNARGPLTESADGRLLLAGDALVWTATGTVIMRLNVRADEPLALSPDGTMLAHAPASSPGVINLWRVPPITP